MKKMRIIENTKHKPSLFERIVALIEEARQKVATVANLAAGLHQL